MEAENLSPDFVAARETCLADIAVVRKEHDVDCAGGNSFREIEWDEGKGRTNTLISFFPSGIGFADWPMESPTPRYLRSETWTFMPDGTVLHKWIEPESPQTDVVIRNLGDSEAQYELSEEEYRLANEQKEIVKEPEKLESLKFKLGQLKPPAPTTA